MMDELTPHQNLKLAECTRAGATSYVPLKAPAGAGHSSALQEGRPRSNEENAEKEVREGVEHRQRRRPLLDVRTTAEKLEY